MDVAAMVRRKRVTLLYPFQVCACVALLSAPAALPLLDKFSSSISSSPLRRVTASSVTTEGSIAPSSGGDSNNAGAAFTTGLAVWSYLLTNDSQTAWRKRFACLSLKTLRTAVAAAAAALAAQPLSALAESPYISAAQSATPDPPSATDSFSTTFSEYLRNLEIPTFSSAISSGVDRIASAVLFHFFPEAQVLQDIPPSHGSVSWKSKNAPPSQSAPTERITVGKQRAPAAAAGRAATRGSTTVGAAESGDKAHTSAGKPPAATPVKAEPLPAAATAVQASDCDHCDSPACMSSCSRSARGSTGQAHASLSASGKEVVSPQAQGDSGSSCFSAFSETSQDTAQRQRVCLEAARQQGTCSSPTPASAAVENLSTLDRAAPADENRAGFSSRLTEAAEEHVAGESPAAAAATTNQKASPPSLYEGGEAAGGGSAVRQSSLLSSARAEDAGREQLGTRSSTAGAAEGRQPAAFTASYSDLKRALREEVELPTHLFGAPFSADHIFASAVTLDVGGVRAFLSSLDVFDPVLLGLAGFHFLLFAGVLWCRRLHAMQLFLMCVVSVLLLCSKQLLLLCSLVEQRLRTDDSLASAVAAFSSAPLSSSPSSTSFTAQFYCSPSAAARATLFLLLFWWLPLFAALLLLVGTVLQELIASMTLLASRKAAATKRRLRSKEAAVTAPAAAAARPTPAATSTRGSAAKL